MSTGTTWTRISIALLLGSALMWTGIPGFASVADRPVQRKAKKKQAEPPPPLPSGPTGPVPPMPLDSLAAVPPQVTYQNNQLTIIAPNSTLADILRAVRKQTGAEIEIPAAPERVVTHLGPGPARDVVADLLNGSRFNYVLLGSPSDQSVLTRVVLVAKTGPQEISPNAPDQPPQPSQAQNPPEPEQPEANEAEATDDNANNDDTSAEQQQPAEAEQQPQEQPQIKTPQQMLQEMQQRQMQLQQQQPPGQPPIPGSGMPPHPPQQD